MSCGIIWRNPAIFWLFCYFLPRPETWSRPRRKARAKTTGLERTLSRYCHPSLIQSLSICFYNCFPLSALPVPMLRQVYFGCLFWCVFLSLFWLRFFEVLGVPFGPQWLHLGAHLEWFWWLLGDFFGLFRKTGHMLSARAGSNERHVGWAWRGPISSLFDQSFRVLNISVTFISFLVIFVSIGCPLAPKMVSFGGPLGTKLGGISGHPPRWVQDLQKCHF